jgi:hypothetical protein
MSTTSPSTVAAATATSNHVARAGLLAGGAGWLLAYLFVRLTCPLEEALHLWTWHLAPAVAAAGGAAALGAVWLDRWKRTRHGGKG